MTRYRFEAEYLGGGFHGWQRQNGVPTVQAAIEQAFTVVMRAPVVIHAGGRTDAGVHARAQSCHVDLPAETDVFRLIRSVNALLRPHPVAIRAIRPAEPGFHARFSAIARHYQYRIFNQPYPSPLRCQQVWHCLRPLDIPAMRTAAAECIGTHDFSSFRGPYCQAASPVKTVTAIAVVSVDNEIRIRVSAPSFLHRQVRNIAGALVIVGGGKKNTAWMRWLLGQRCRGAASITAPAHGLCLEKIEYDPQRLPGKG